MRPGARGQAAIEILTDIEARKRPAADAVRDWMLSHRFAGSKDRAEIGDLVFGALRWRASSAWRFGADDARALVWGALHWGFGESAERIAAHCHDDPHAPPPPSEKELAALRDGSLDGAPAWVRGDYPEWLDVSLARAFGDDRGEEGAALAAPASLDLRANTLKTTREKLLASLRENPHLKSAPEETPHSPFGVRIPWKRGGAFGWSQDVSFQKGWFEVQDEGSQLAALLSGAKPGQQVADVCAGGGGKTLALAAMLENKGQIYAFDVDGRRLSALPPRAERAGVRNLQIRPPLRSGEALADLTGKMDIVFVDAPCSGSGTWRRAPDSKWRLRPGALAKRREEQQQALDLAAPLVKPGGRMVYVTCSVLPEENEDAVNAFLARSTRFRADAFRPDAPHLARAPGVQFTPRLTGCDGFYVSILETAS
jgi:16S rRNA (cytosine967-C5)-methyltransferase